MEDETQVNEKFFAKLNGKRGKHLLVFSDEDDMSKDALQTFAEPAISRSIDFEPGRSLHGDEWFVVSLDDTQVAEMVTPYLSNALNTVNNDTITADDYEKVAALYKTDSLTLLITKITPGLKVESKTFIGLNDHPEIKTYEKAIEFTGQVDAYYDGSKKLFFRNYSKISSLFTGIEVFYRNATAAEKTLFISKSFFSVQNIDADSIGMRDSNKIAAILDDERIKLDDATFQQKVLEYAREFVPELVSEDNKLKITNKETLHGSLNLLTERYYKSELFGDKREAIDSTKLDT